MMETYGPEERSRDANTVDMSNEWRKRIGEIVARFSADVIDDALAQLLERTRKLVRAKLAETFPYGTHSFTDAIDGDGHGSGPVKIRFSLSRVRHWPPTCPPLRLPTYY